MAERVMTLKYLHGQGSSSISAPKLATGRKLRNNRSQSSCSCKKFISDTIISFNCSWNFVCAQYDHSMLLQMPRHVKASSRNAPKQTWQDESCSASPGHVALVSFPRTQSVTVSTVMRRGKPQSIVCSPIKLPGGILWSCDFTGWRRLTGFTEYWRC